ncbi:MAG: carboxypeptidase-like regulatory domain-containing protein, partial [Planctomycetota bacterium]
PHGVPVAGARIVGQWLPDFLGEELAHEAETGPGGAFELAPIPPGVATFVIEAAGRRQYRVQRTVAGEPLSLQLPLADAPFTVRGTVSRACADGTLVQVTLSGEGFERHGLSGTLAGSFAIELEGVELTGPATLTLHLGTTGGEERRAVEPYVDQIYLDGLFAE